MSKLNIHFLMSGKQFNSKSKETLATNNTDVVTLPYWSVKNFKSDNFYQIKKYTMKLKNSSKEFQSNSENDN